MAVSDEPEYIRQRVYPQTRRVLLSPDYLERETTSYLLRRAAYEHGLEALKYLAGFRSAYGKGISAGEVAKRLQAEILQTAKWVLDLSGVNSNAPVMRRARNLVIASRRAAGERTDRPDSGPGTMGVDAAIREYLKRAVAPDPLRRVEELLDPKVAAGRN